MSGIPATVISLVALVLGIIGGAIPYWEYHGNSFGQINIGLWQYCAGINIRTLVSTSVYGCERLDLTWTITLSMKVVRASVVLGSILQAFALVCSVTKLCVKKEQHSLFQFAGALAFFSGLLMILGTVIFGVKTRHETEIYFSNELFDLHAGFALCIVSGCLAITAGILYLLVKRRQTPPQSCITAQPGALPVQVVYPATGYSAGYPAGVILQPPPSDSNPAANPAAPTDVQSRQPQGLYQYR